MYFHFPLNVGPDMYRIVLRKASTLSATPLPPGLREQAPQGPRRERWSMGRVLLSYTSSPLLGIIYDEQDEPAFASETPLWFNLSHSGDDIVLLLSDKGEVSCDIEVIRPCANWRWLANAVFNLGRHAEMDTVRPDQQLGMFQCIWMRKEVIAKQRGGSAWQIVSADSTYNSSLSVSHCQLENSSLAICTPTLFTLTAGNVQRIDSAN